MSCPICGESVPCYEQLYGQDHETPFMIRFIGHKNSVAMIIEEIKINKNEAEDNENIYGTIRCSICHSLVIVETFYPDNYEKIYF